MVPRYRFKNAQTRKLFCELAQDPNIQSGALRAIAHISPRIPEAAWRTMFQELVAVLLGPAGARRRPG